MGRKQKDPKRGFGRVCEHCSVPFVAANTYVGRFCSHDCYALHLRERPGSSLEGRFWTKVQKTDDCWQWIGVIRPNGYGQIWNREIQSMEKAHRVSWRLHFGPIPDGMYVCHRCDNRRCVRPDHLFLGAPAVNSADTAKKGRANRGEGRWKAKLTETMVRAIRDAHSRGATQAHLATRFGVTPGAIHLVVTRRNWRHVT